MVSGGHWIYRHPERLDRHDLHPRGCRARRSHRAPLPRLSAALPYGHHRQAKRLPRCDTRLTQAPYGNHRRILALTDGRRRGNATAVAANSPLATRERPVALAAFVMDPRH